MMADPRIRTRCVALFAVPGRPIPQGSMAIVRNRRGQQVLLHSRKTKTRESVQAWRKRAAIYARRAMDGQPPIDGPIAVRARFMLARPESRRRAPFPAWKPDGDKLARALGDAMQGVVYVEDSRVVSWSIEKLWVEDGQEPCTQVTVYALERVEG